MKSTYALNMEATNEELVRSIFEACAELSRRSSRSVSPDGHLVGSIGEIYAAEELGLTLATASNPGYDAVDRNGALVEIKTTTRSSISLSAEGTGSERLIVVKLDPISGTPGIVFDGPAQSVWALAGPPAKNGQRRLSLSRLLRESS